MYENRALKALLGNSLNMPEEDMDDLRVESQTGYPYEEAALKSYYFLTILDSIRTDEFRESFNATIPLLRKEYEFKDFQELCFEIIRYIKERYDFIFPQIVKIEDAGDTQDVISFIIELITTKAKGQIDLAKQPFYIFVGAMFIGLCLGGIIYCVGFTIGSLVNDW